MNLLEVKKVSMFFGGLAAISDVSFEIRKGEILGLDWSERCRQDHHVQCGERFF